MSRELIAGFEKFINTPGRYGPDGEMPRLIAEGQNPDYFIISCIDSRANPGTVLSPTPGTFFAHKAMGAIVRPYKKGTALSAALSFAINHGGIKTVIVFGHTQCGAVKALVDGIADDEISSFVEVAAAARQRTQNAGATDIHAETEKQIILQSIENLKTYPSVAHALKNATLTIKAWLFDMKAGALLEYDDKSAKFQTLAGGGFGQ